MAAFTITCFEGDAYEEFPIGECDDMLEAQFLARDEVCENAAARYAAVLKGTEIVYLIDANGGSGYIARRDGTPVTRLDEADAILHRA